MRRGILGLGLGLALLPAAALCADEPTLVDSSLATGFASPPPEARLRAYWWWLNGNVTKASITRDLEEMAAKGFGGALICDAGGAEQDGNDRVPHGPTFFSPEWRELYRHTLAEAHRLGLELSLNIQSGWNLGGPMVPAEDAPKKLVWSEAKVTGPRTIELALPHPLHAQALYQEVAVVAYPVRPGHTHRPLANHEFKALHKALRFSAPDTTPLLEELPPEPGEEDTASKQVVDLSARMDGSGTLRWDVPAGDWEVLRFGATLNDHARVSTHSDGWAGYALDPFDAGAFTRYWDAVVEPLLVEAGPLAGTTLKYLHTDSWEVEVANWTPTLREEFRQRRGYDLLPFLPVVAGRIVDGRDQSHRFLHDFRRTMGDLAIANHYVPFSDLAARHGLMLHPESGGPHAVPVDSLQCLGMDNAPMSEFWARSWRHRVKDEDRFFVKQPASAAHTYGRRLVLAEGFTTIGPHWQETLWDNLKPSFDRAACEGLNRLVWHAFVCSPESMGVPGQQYFAGTHLNPNVTWWSRSAPFFDYINRCQFLLQQGEFVADVLYYYGDHVPNFTQLKASDPAGVLPGYDYDVATEQVLLERLAVKDDRLVLPNGMSYRVLVLPDREAISLPVLRKVDQLVAAGATVIGRRPTKATGLTDYPASDPEVQALAGKLWGHGGGELPNRYGKGHVYSPMPARDVLAMMGVPRDVKLDPHPLDYIHRYDGQAEIYFVANRSDEAVDTSCQFRVYGKIPELWDAVTGTIRPAPAWQATSVFTLVRLALPPYGSTFVVFREPTPAAGPGLAASPAPEPEPRLTLEGSWQVTFDPAWGGPPAPVAFDRLLSWTDRPEPGIRFYSGTATYRLTFDLPEALRFRRDGSRLWLDLGRLRELAEVRLNDRSLGVVWAPPFRVDATDALRARGNRLEIDVVNFWPNRIIGDQSLPASERLTRTNIRKLTKDTPLIESGLLGPVRLLESLP